MSSNLPRSDQYELQECLVFNNKTETWKALDTRTGRWVVIKIYKLDQPDLLPHAYQNARAIASLQHSGIIQINDIHTDVPPHSDSSRVYLVREYIEGPTLAGYIAQTSGQKKFPPADNILYIFSALSSAIDFAHQHGVIHRDLKPSNILFKPAVLQHQPGEPVLVDFTITGLSGSSTTTPVPGNPWPGTPLYLSPEQARGYIGNELSDIYALGIMLYEVCTGVPPFQGANAGVIMSQHINTLPPSPVLINPMIPPALAEVILHSIAKNPATRYSSALSMANALADAFNLPLPENVTIPDYLNDQMSAPTFFKPLQTHYLPHQTPLTPLPHVISSPAPSFAIASTPRIATHLSNPPGAPLTNGSTYQQTAFDPSAENLSTKETMLLALPLTPTPPPPVRQKRRKGLIVALMAVTMLILVGSGLGAYLLLNHSSSAPVVNSNPIVGYAYFVSSGQVNEGSTHGVNDELLLELRNVPNAPAGKSYYAWLLSDKSQVDGTALLLGELVVSHGNVHFPYQGDAQHDNLLASYSRFLITQEDASVTPTNPTPERTAWVYYAELPQKPNTADPNQLSMLDHMRDLLSDDPTLKGLGLSGGLDIWLYRNTEKILEWSGSARDYWGSQSFLEAMRSQFVRILDFLDGVGTVQTDIPGVPIIANKTEGAIGLLRQSQGFPSYLQLIGGHLSAIVQAPGITPDRSKLADQINTAINNVRTWLEHVYQDARQLYFMTNPQLLQPSSLTILDDMVNFALSAYVGHLDPSSHQVLEGVVQVHDSIQRLAAFDITLYKAGI